MGKLKINITPSLQRLDLVVKGRVNTRFMGNYASAFKGSGLEFADYRVYTQSDDANRIDWVASSRARKLLIKEFIEERNLNVVFLVDVSAKMMLGSLDKLKCEYAAELVSSFSHTVLRAGDFIGMIMFSDKVVKEIHPTNGMAQFSIVSEALSKVGYYGGGCSIKRALQHALQSVEQNSLVILVSDFISLENYTEELVLAASKFNFIGVMVRDPIDMELPRGMGQVQVQDPITKEVLLISPSEYAEIYSRRAKKDVAKLEMMFRNSGSDFLPLYTNKPFLKDLIEFFRRRKASGRNF